MRTTSPGSLVLHAWRCQSLFTQPAPCIPCLFVRIRSTTRIHTKLVTVLFSCGCGNKPTPNSVDKNNFNVFPHIAGGQKKPGRWADSTVPAGPSALQREAPGDSPLPVSPNCGGLPASIAPGSITPISASDFTSSLCVQSNNKT